MRISDWSSDVCSSDLWADEEERKIRRGEFIDPRAGKITLAAWWEKWFATKRLEQATVDAYTSRWRNHIGPSFGSWPLVSIQSWDVEKWVTDQIGRAHV